MYAGHNVLRYVEQTVKRYALLTVKLYVLLTVKLYVLLIAVCVEPDPALVKWFLSLMADNRTSDVSNG